MKKLMKIVGLCSLFFSLCAQQSVEPVDTVHVSVAAQSYEKISVFLGYIGQRNEALKEIAEYMAADFQMTEQCQVQVQGIDVFKKNLR